MTYDKKLANLFLTQNSLNSEGLQTLSFGNIGASSDAIKSISDNFIELIPKDYIEFLKCWNGCTLFDLQSQAGFQFFSTYDIEFETNSFKEIYECNWDESIILFCAVIGSGDFIGFRINSNCYEIIDCCHDDLPENWKIITDSFSDFVNQLINARGLSYWLY
jgi:SMI1 / KNR4 family (SUKH-1)